jgi:WD40 repeat protein
MLSKDKPRLAAADQRLVLLALILLLLAVALNASATRAQADDTGGGVLLFARLANGEPGGEGLYTINADGTGERLLARFEDMGYPYTLDSGGYRCPAWSPDGTRIAFNAALENRSQIVVVNADGSGAHTVYEVQSDDDATRNLHFPRWVPNSDRLSFGVTEADPATGNLFANGVRSVRLDGSDLQTIRDDVALTYDSGAPVQIGSMLDSFLTLTHAWSPDGRQLAIASLNNRVFLTDATGTTLTPLESSQWAAGGVDWSPDGRRIASSHFYIAAYTPTDTDLQPIVPMPSDVLDETIESVTWSPDGAQIAYTSYVTNIANDSAPWHIVLRAVDVATGQERELVRTPDFGRGGYPWAIACVDWRPDASAAVSAPEALAVFSTNTPSAAPAKPTEGIATCSVEAPQNVNLRAEPAPDAALAGSMPRGTRFEVDGWTDAADYRWYHLPDGAWVRGDVVTVDEAACAVLPPRTRSGGLAG